MLGQSPAAVEADYRALDHPMTRQHDQAMPVGAFHDLRADLSEGGTQGSPGFGTKMPVPGVAQDMPHIALDLCIGRGDI